MAFGSFLPLSPASFESATTLLEALQPDHHELVLGALQVAGISTEEFLAEGQPNGDVYVPPNFRKVLTAMDPDQWSRFKATALEIQAKAFGLQAPKGRNVGADEPIPVAILDHPLGGIVGKDPKSGEFRIRMELELGQSENAIGTLNAAGHRLVIHVKNLFGDPATIPDLKRFLQGNLSGADNIEILTGGSDYSDRVNVVIRDRSITKILDLLNEKGPQLASKHDIQLLQQRIEQYFIHAQRKSERLQQYQSVNRKLAPAHEQEELQEILLQMEQALARERQCFSDSPSDNPLDLLRTERAGKAVVNALKTTVDAIELAQREFEKWEKKYLEHRYIFFCKTEKQIEAAADAAITMGRNYHKVYILFKKIREKLKGSTTKPDSWKILRAQKKEVHAMLGAIKAEKSSIEEKWGEERASLEKEALIELSRRAEKILAQQAPFIEEIDKLERQLVVLEVRKEEEAEPALAQTKTVDPDDNLKTTIFLYDALRGYLTPPSPDKLSPLNKILADAITALKEIDRMAASAFGNNIAYWPSSVSGAYRELHGCSQKIRDGQSNIRSSAEQCRRGIEAGEHPAKIRSLALLGLAGIRSLGEQMPAEIEALLPAPRGQKVQKSLLTSWRESRARILERMEIEKNKPFKLEPAALEDFKLAREEKVGAWELELGFLEMQANHTLRLVPEEQQTSELLGVAETILGTAGKKGHIDKAREAISLFIKAFDAFEKERVKADPDRKELKKFFFQMKRRRTIVRNNIYRAKMKLFGTTVSGAIYLQNLTDLAKRAAEEEKNPKRFEVPGRRYLLLGHEVEVKDEKVYVDGVEIKGVQMNAALRNQEKKLDLIVRTLAVPSEELKISADLAHPPFREKVEGLLGEGKFLRRLVDVNDTLGTAIVFDERFQTVFYVPYKEGWVVKGARAIVPMFHGAGGARSTGLTMMAPAIKLRNDFKFSAITFDTPNHGHAIKDPRFHDLSEFIAWTNSVLNYFRYLSGGAMPLIAIGRSHGDNVLSEFATRHPGLLKGIIAISGYDPAWTESNYPSLIERIAQGDFKPHPTGLPMVLDHEGRSVVVEGGQLLFGQSESPFQNQWTFLDPQEDETRRQTPTLLLQGTKDADYSSGVPDFWKKREATAKRLGFDFLTVQEGPHDLLSLTNPPATIEAVYKKISEFIDGIIAQFIKAQ